MLYRIWARLWRISAVVIRGIGAGRHRSNSGPWRVPGSDTPSTGDVIGVSRLRIQAWYCGMVKFGSMIMWTGEAAAQKIKLRGVFMQLRRRLSTFWCPAGSSWASLGIPDTINRALVSEGFRAPSMAQSLALPASRRTSNLILGTQTGTGKTLAYAITVLERLLYTPLSPAIILAPSTELCHQISTLFTALLSSLDLNLSCAHVRPSLIPSSLTNAGVIVATPLTAGRILAPRGLLSSLRRIVVDEADFMLSGGSSHALHLKKLLSLTSRNQSRHLIVGATLPKSSAIYLKKLFPTIETIQCDNSFCVNVTRLYIPLKEDLISSLKDVMISGERTLIFCNTSAMADHVLCSWPRGKAALFSSSISVADRCQILDSFNNHDFSILICTDMLWFLLFFLLFLILVMLGEHAASIFVT